MDVRTQNRWDIRVPVLVWIDKGKVNEAIVTIITLLKHNPKVSIHVVHHKADDVTGVIALGVANVTPADNAPALIRGIDLLGHVERIVAIRAGCLVRGDIGEMLDAPLTNDLPVGGVAMSWIWGDESKRDRLLKLDVDFHTLNTRVDGAFDVDCIMLQPGTLIARARSTGCKSLVEYARSRHGEMRTVVEFMNHMAPTNLGMPDSLYGHTEEIGFTLISPHETLEKKRHLSEVKICSFRDRNFEWGDVNIYKPAYLMLPVADFYAVVHEHSKSFDKEWVKRVKQTADLCSVMETK